MQTKTLILFPAVLFALAAGPASSQSATMTVPGLGQMLAGNDLRQTLACQGGAVTVNGNNNRLTLTGSCTQVVVNGNKNVVAAATVGQIVANGSSNTVSWHKALKGKKPIIQSAGSGNKITQR